MNARSPDAGLLIWQLMIVAFIAQGVVALVRFGRVLPGADRTIDKICAYIRHRS